MPASSTARVLNSGCTIRACSAGNWGIPKFVEPLRGQDTGGLVQPDASLASLAITRAASPDRVPLKPRL